MITTFSTDAVTYAAERTPILDESYTELRPHVRDALNRAGLPSWEVPVVDAALDQFDLTVRAAVDQWSPAVDEMRDAFEVELARALADTAPAPREEIESRTDTLARWLSVSVHNAAIEAAATSAESQDVSLEWVAGVGCGHEGLHGVTATRGEGFTVGGTELAYPAQPVDPVSDCRCIVRPVLNVSRETFTRITSVSDVPAEVSKRLVDKYGAFGHIPTEYLDDATGIRYRFAGYEEKQGDVSRETSEEPEFDTAVIVALPAADDPVNGASSESHAHCTLLFLGPVGDLSMVDLSDALGSFVEAGQVGVITDKVNGTANLGADGAMVSLLDAANLVHIRNGLLEDPTIKAAHESVEQFPTWIPHVTLGYPDTPPAGPFDGEAITFDRLALWFGDDKSTVYPLGEAMPEKKSPGVQEVEDAFAAAVKEAAPVKDAEPAEAAPTADATTPTEPELRKWHGVIAPEAAPSGDRRQFAERALTARSLPLPLKAMFIDDEGHKGSVVVGRIDNVYRKDGLILADGVWDNSIEADRAWGMIERKMWRGVSVDVDAAEIDIEAMDDAELLEFLAGRISSATVCAIPAFAQAFVANGGWENYDPASAPNGEMNEIPEWGGAALVASAVMAPKKVSVDYFKNPMLDGPTGLTLGEDGHIFGHLAAWDACHIGFEVCTTAPASATDYAYFLTGQVFTDAGPVAVGQITLGKKDIGGHAPDGISMAAAIAHYDRTGTAVADITVGEDAWGIWFSGKLRNNVTEDQLHELFAAGLSGDWREVRFRGRSSMEMCAALAVNVPGFPIPRTSFAMDGDRQVSLVAAGVVAPRKAESEVTPEFRAQMDAYFAEKDRSKRMADALSEITMARSQNLFTEITALKGK